MPLKSRHFWKFTPPAVGATKPAPPAPAAPSPGSTEPKFMAEPGDGTGTDEEALAWAEEHDPETAALLRAEEIE